MLSPISLASLSISPSDFLRPVRAISPAAQPTPGTQQLTAPLSPSPQVAPGAGAAQDGGTPSRNLPRGSLLDLSV